jgi:hypothetical protein
VIITSPRRRLSVALAVAAAIGGTFVSVHYANLDLTLSHYDARGHLIVARRIVDNLTPGWRQIGAIWLPLPHLLNVIPVQIDSLYRSGASGVAISVMAFALATSSIGWIVLAITRSVAAAVVAASVFALNPNLLYLQATPMTEPLLLGLILLAVALLIEWVRADASSPRRSAVGWAFALACLTRYEAWPVTFSALALAVWARGRSGAAWDRACGDVARIAMYPALAIIGFSVFSRIVVEQWLVSSGFFIPDNPAIGRPMAVVRTIVWGIDRLTGHALFAAGGIGLAIALTRAVLLRGEAATIIVLSLLTTLVLPFGAFLNGHPFRIRYMVPVIAAQAIGAGVAAASWRRARIATICVVVAISLVELRPLDSMAPMVVEAQWDRPVSRGRQRVTECLKDRYRDETILASMGSLGHYMQELSRAGLRLNDFLHEGNDEIWDRALDRPRPFAGWILISEEDPRDPIRRLARENPDFLKGFSRVCEGGAVALYERVAER